MIGCSARCVNADLTLGHAQGSHILLNLRRLAVEPRSSWQDPDSESEPSTFERIPLPEVRFARDTEIQPLPQSDV